MRVFLLGTLCLVFVFGLAAIGQAQPTDWGDGDPVSFGTLSQVEDGVPSELSSQEAVAKVEMALNDALADNQQLFAEFDRRYGTMRTRYVELRERPVYGGFKKLRFGFIGTSFDTWEFSFPDEELDSRAQLGIQALPLEVYEDINAAAARAYDDGFDTFPVKLPTGFKAKVANTFGRNPKKGFDEQMHGLVLDENAADPAAIFDAFQSRAALIDEVLVTAKAFHGERTGGDSGLRVDKEFEKNFEAAHALELEGLEGAVLEAKQREHAFAVESQLDGWKRIWEEYIGRHNDYLDDLERLINKYRPALLKHYKRASRDRLRQALEVWHQANIAEGSAPGSYVQALPCDIPTAVEELIQRAFFNGMEHAIAALIEFEKQKRDEPGSRGSGSRTFTAIFAGKEIASGVKRKRYEFNSGSVSFVIDGIEEPEVVQLSSDQPLPWFEYFER